MVAVLVGFALAGRRQIEAWQAGWRAQEAANAYRKIGLPWVKEDLDPQGALTGGRNAALLIRGADRSLVTDRFSIEAQSISDLLFKHRYEEAERKLAANLPSLQLASKTEACERLDFGRDWDQGVELRFPERDYERELIRLLCLRARLRAGRNDSAGCIRDLRTAWHLSELSGQEPTLLSAVVQEWCERYVLRAVQRCAAGFVSDAKVLGQLSALLEEPHEGPNMCRALRGEAYFGLTAARNAVIWDELAKNGPGSVNPEEFLRTGFPRDRGALAFVTRHLEVWSEAGAAMNRNKDAPVALAKEFDRIGANAIRRDDPRDAMILTMFPKGLMNQATAILNGRALRYCTDALIVALKLEAETGRLPEGIEDIPGRWADPWNGQELRVKRFRNGIRIYSVGHDLQDNGALDRVERPGIKPEDEGYDVVASFPPL